MPAGVFAGRVARQKTAEDIGVLGNLWRCPLLTFTVAAGVGAVVAVTAIAVGWRVATASSLWTERGLPMPARHRLGTVCG
jgi:hypothetical protein